LGLSSNNDSNNDTNDGRRLGLFQSELLQQFTQGQGAYYLQLLNSILYDDDDDDVDEEEEEDDDEDDDDDDDDDDSDLDDNSSSPIKKNDKKKKDEQKSQTYMSESINSNFDSDTYKINSSETFGRSTEDTPYLNESSSINTSSLNLVSFENPILTKQSRKKK
jgi:hypothetical protein